MAAVKIIAPFLLEIFNQCLDQLISTAGWLNSAAAVFPQNLKSKWTHNNKKQTIFLNHDTAESARHQFSWRATLFRVSGLLNYKENHQNVSSKSSTAKEYLLNCQFVNSH